MAKMNMGRKILTVTLLYFVALLVACGTKGDLYIPEQRYPQKEQKNEPSETSIPTEQIIKE